VSSFLHNPSFVQASHNAQNAYPFRWHRDERQLDAAGRDSRCLQSQWKHSAANRKHARALLKSAVLMIQRGGIHLGYRP
jgi:hypothetical protein